MASKKKAISELIKSDMSRRVIGDELQFPETGGGEADEPGTVSLPDAPAPDEKSLRKSGAVKRAPAVKVEHETAKEAKPPAASAALVEFLTAQVEAGGMTEDGDLRNFYDFLRSQTLRYLRGFNAGRRFYGG